jgi:hypothetical protein
VIARYILAVFSRNVLSQCSLAFSQCRPITVFSHILAFSQYRPIAVFSIAVFSRILAVSSYRSVLSHSRSVVLSQCSFAFSQRSLAVSSYRSVLSQCRPLAFSYSRILAVSSYRSVLSHSRILAVFFRSVLSHSHSVLSQCSLAFLQCRPLAFLYSRILAVSSYSSVLSHSRILVAFSYTVENHVTVSGNTLEELLVFARYTSPV